MNGDLKFSDVSSLGLDIIVYNQRGQSCKKEWIYVVEEEGAMSSKKSGLLRS